MFGEAFHFIIVQSIKFDSFLCVPKRLNAGISPGIDLHLQTSDFRENE